MKRTAPKASRSVSQAGNRKVVTVKVTGQTKTITVKQPIQTK